MDAWGHANMTPEELSKKIVIASLQFIKEYCTARNVASVDKQLIMALHIGYLAAMKSMGTPIETLDKALILAKEEMEKYSE